LNVTDSLHPPAANRAPRGFQARLLANVLKHLHWGSLRLITPDGQVMDFRGSAPGAHGELRILHWRFARRVLQGAEIGFAEAYRDGLFESPDLTALLAVLSNNYLALEAGLPLGKWIMGIHRRLHVLRKNTRRGSRRNIHAHYDLGNDFYQQWLDPGMTYSSAMFAEAGDRSCLNSAQTAKYDHILDQLNLPAGAHILEVGCGWGAFAEHAARTRGIKVTGITISRAQYEYARARIRAAGLDRQVEIRLMDYRDVPGQFDGIVSIEMFEAVGEEFWPIYFRTLRERLKAGGQAVIQTITIAEDKFDLYRRTTDFIREFIFPGGLLPSPSRFVMEAQRAGFIEAGRRSFGTDYAETLRRWRSAFDAAGHKVHALGFDERFQRLWRFYLTYCEVGFDQRLTDVSQFHLRSA
jgi:cyclopropane-fatty-acyl-phospholipid synthase